MFIGISAIKLYVDNGYTLDSLPSGLVVRNSPQPQASTTCFPSDSIVLINCCEQAPVSSIEVGTSVVGLDLAHKKIVKTEVYTYGHKCTITKAKFIQLTFKSLDSSTQTLCLSPQHLLFKASVQDQALHATKAHLISPGDYLLQIHTPSAELIPVEVTEVTVCTKTGIFNPITTAGTMFVDGILVSCYCTVPHALAHLAFSPLRWAHQHQNPIFSGLNDFYWGCIHGISE